MSFVLFFLFMVFATTKFAMLIKRHNPMMMQTDIQNALSIEDVINFQDTGFKIAWGAESY